LESKDIKITDGDKNFKINLRKAITDCRLNLDKALKRCEYAYSKLKGAVCERVRWGGDDEWDLAPFVTLKCPSGYKRYGCCKCMRDCNKHKGLKHEDKLTKWTGFDYCMKDEQTYSNTTKDTTKIKDTKNWEIYKLDYVEKCKDGYERFGDYKCYVRCPLGWPDLGDRCMKKGALMVFPFVWQVGDGQSVEDEKKDGDKKKKQFL